VRTPVHRPEHRTARTWSTRTKRDPFADLDSVRTHMHPASEVRARALAAIEQYANRSGPLGAVHDAAEHATKLV
jgi:hypothetical protein